MLRIQSPFLHQIEECRVAMRKLRKKIYKHLVVAGARAKAKEHNQNLMGILKSRNLPDFVIDSLKKKRTIDFNYLKNVTVAGMASPNEISMLTSNQENEIQGLLKQHKERIMKSEKKSSSKLQIDKKQSTSPSESEPDEEESRRSSVKSEINEEALEQIEELECEDMQPHNFDIDAFFVNGPSFMVLNQDMESQEEWLRF